MVYEFRQVCTEKKWFPYTRALPSRIGPHIVVGSPTCYSDVQNQRLSGERQKKLNTSQFQLVHGCHRASQVLDSEEALSKSFVAPMAYRYRIEPSLGLLLDRFEGKMGWHDLWEGTLESAEDPEFRPGMNVVTDLTNAELDLGYKEMRELVSATVNAPTVRFGRVAIIAPGPLRYGLARMYDALSEEKGLYHELRIFSDFWEARTWLGLPEDVELRL